MVASLVFAALLSGATGLSCFHCNSWDIDNVLDPYDIYCSSSTYTGEPEYVDGDTYICEIIVYGNGDVLRGWALKSSSISDGTCEHWDYNGYNTRCYCSTDDCNIHLCEECDGITTPSTSIASTTTGVTTQTTSKPTTTHHAPTGSLICNYCQSWQEGGQDNPYSPECINSNYQGISQEVNSDEYICETLVYENGDVKRGWTIKSSSISSGQCDHWDYNGHNTKCYCDTDYCNSELCEYCDGATSPKPPITNTPSTPPTPDPSK
ncbi:unnamed protein product, partial [Meganyctiphanes norvegica]